eukprot:353529-Chlamydomonas_euryale.AAC.15
MSARWRLNWSSCHRHVQSQQFSRWALSMPAPCPSSVASPSPPFPFFTAAPADENKTLPSLRKMNGVLLYRMVHAYATVQMSLTIPAQHTERMQARTAPPPAHTHSLCCLHFYYSLAFPGAITSVSFSAKSKSLQRAALPRPALEDQQRSPATGLHTRKGCTTLGTPATGSARLSHTSSLLGFLKIPTEQGF